MIQWIDRAKAYGDNLGNCRSRLGGEMLPLRSVIYYRKHLNTILFIGLHFLEVIKTVTAMIRYCYYLMASGK